MKFAPSSNAEKEFYEKFRLLTRTRNRSTVWSDMMYMWAAACSNAVDIAHYEQREEGYMSIAKMYNREELSIIAELFAQVTVELTRNPYQDLLGTLYMKLSINNTHIGQIFTTYHIAQLMAQCAEQDIAEQVQKLGWTSMSDPTCGSGIMLIAYAQQCSMQKVNYQQSVLFCAQDISLTAANMCYVQMTLLGCAGYVVVGDALTKPITGPDLLHPSEKENIWYTPMFFHPTWQMRKML